jgi:hypothetical protein
MGRPLNSKYFSRGTRGEDIVGVNVVTPGSYSSTTFPTVSFTPPTPQLPNSVPPVAAVSTVTAVQGIVTANGSGYHLGDVLTVQGGTRTTPASFSVNAVVTTNATLTAAGTNYDVSAGAKDEIWFDTAGWSTPLKIRVITVTGSAVATFSVIQQGVWSGPGAAPTTVTGSSTHNGPIDGNGSGATFSLTYGVYSATPVVDGGSYTAVSNALVTSGASTTVAPAGGTGALLRFNYGVQTISVSNPGSGYIASPSVTIGTTASAGTPIIGEAGAYKVLIPIAYVLGGSQGLPANIIKQINTNTYLMQTSENTSSVTLVASSPLKAGQAWLIATDVNGSTYYVTKLTAHKARVTRQTMNGSFAWPTGADVPWTFEAALPTSVQIRNA